MTRAKPCRPTDPIEHAAVPFPLGQRLVNVAVWPWGAAFSVTDTPEAGPLAAETCTAKDAAWPGLMLACEACTLMHSSGWEDGEAVGEELTPPRAALAHRTRGGRSRGRGRDAQYAAQQPKASEPPDRTQAASGNALASRISVGLSRRVARKNAP